MLHIKEHVLNLKELIENTPFVKPPKLVKEAQQECYVPKELVGGLVVSRFAPNGAGVGFDS